MSYNLYLDDVRDPQTEKEWVIVRNYQQFITTLEEQGAPEHVSFDHDIGDEGKDGKDCAMWMLENGYEPDSWNVHSANPVGKKRIESVFQIWNRIQNENT